MMSGTGGADAGDGMALALFEIASQRIGVPIAQVVQALPRPANITRLPRHHNAIEGVFLLRGIAVPLINLHPLLQPDGRASVERCIVVALRAEGKWVAIYVDRVLGLTKIRPDAVRQVFHDDDQTEFFHSVAMEAGHDTALSLLDPLRLANQVRVWTEGADSSAADATAEAASAERGESPSFVMVKAGSTCLGFPAADVGEMVASLQVQKMGAISPGFGGMTKWRGKDVPVWDLTQSLGLPAATLDERAGYMVLMTEDACAAFPVTAIQAVQAIAMSAMQPVTESEAPWTHSCLGSVLNAQQERVLLMDPRRVLSNVPLSGLQRREQAHQPGKLAALEYAADSTKSAYIVVRSGQEWALPMANLLEIVRLPEQFLQALDSGAATLGYLEWRGASVEVVDLLFATQGRASAVGDNARIILVQLGARTLALLVEDVLALIAAHAGVRSSYQAMGKMVHMVSLGHGLARKSYQTLDLASLAWGGQTV